MKYGLKNRWNLNEVVRIQEILYEKQMIYRKKLEIYDKRRDFKKSNYMYELNRSKFYVELEKSEIKVSKASSLEMRVFWEKVWANKEHTKTYEIVQNSNHENEETEYFDLRMNDETLRKEITNNIKFLPDWKTPGIDKTYYFFIKNLRALHNSIMDEMIRLIKDFSDFPKWFFTGNTFMIVNANGEKADDHRPITCMSNIYKIFTRSVNFILKKYCDCNNLLSENQLGTVKGCQGAKEQVLISK